MEKQQRMARGVSGLTLCTCHVLLCGSSLQTLTNLIPEQNKVVTYRLSAENSFADADQPDGHLNHKTRFPHFLM